MRPARRQEGMRGLGDLRTAPIPRNHRRPRTRRQASRHAWSYPCPPASALARAVCPPIRACARTGGQAQQTPFSWPRGSAAGRTDAVRPARRQEGMRGSGDLRTAPIPRNHRRPRTRRQASRRAWSCPCPPASALARAVCPPIRAFARTGGREDKRNRHRPPGRAAARLGGQTPCVQHGVRRACAARETRGRRRSRATPSN